jgi:hypothetical protein
MAGSAWPVAGGVGADGVGTGADGSGHGHRHDWAWEPERAAAGFGEASSDEGGHGLRWGRERELATEVASSNEGGRGVPATSSGGGGVGNETTWLGAVSLKLIISDDLCHSHRNLTISSRGRKPPIFCSFLTFTKIH